MNFFRDGSTFYFDVHGQICYRGDDSWAGVVKRNMLLDERLFKENFRIEIETVSCKGHKVVSFPSYDDTSFLDYEGNEKGHNQKQKCYRRDSKNRKKPQQQNYQIDRQFSKNAMVFWPLDENERIMDDERIMDVCEMDRAKSYDNSYMDDCDCDFCDCYDYYLYEN